MGKGRPLFGDSPNVEPAEVDPTVGADVKVGTAVRDGAVDPRAVDHLGPSNAGQANPHGPDVVNPELRAEGVQGERVERRPRAKKD